VEGGIRARVAFCSLPPRFIGASVFAPLVILITVAAVWCFSPLLLALAILASPSRSGPRRALRLTWFGLTWLVMESAALAACLGLWLVSGFGGADTHRSLDGTGNTRSYGGSWPRFPPCPQGVQAAGRDLRAAATRTNWPPPIDPTVIVLSRHAGPGDSFLLVHHLLSLYHRKPES